MARDPIDQASIRPRLFSAPTEASCDFVSPEREGDRSAVWTGRRPWNLVHPEQDGALLGQRQAIPETSRRVTRQPGERAIGRGEQAGASDVIGSGTSSVPELLGEFADHFTGVALPQRLGNRPYGHRALAHRC